MIIPSLVLLGTLARGESPSRWDAPWRTDTTLSIPVAVRPTGRVPVRGLPLVVKRFSASDLEPSGPSPAPLPPRATSRRDSSTPLRFQGEKTVRVAVGGDGGVAVDQTLRLDAEGEVSPGVSVKAHLSDQQVPLGGEGSTESLQELESVSLQVRTRTWDFLAGDQDWVLPAGETPGATRRIRGASAGWQGPFSGRATLGATRARWMRHVFQGQEGRQEGWILPGPEGRSHAPVVPGSERVQIDGVRLVAGTDYVLRPVEGVVDFLPRRRISGHDRIEVEWQAAVLDYRRSLQAAQLEKPFEDAGGWSGLVWAASESDDPSRPLSFAADAESDSVLRAAGGDAGAASRADSSLVPLPRSRTDVGFRSRWRDSATTVSTEVRATREQTNLASTLDDPRDGISAIASLGHVRGDLLSEGGIGRLRTRVDARIATDEFQPISGRIRSGAAGADLWNDGGEDAPGGFHEESGSLGWEALEGLGATLGTGIREDSSALSGRAQWSAGLDRSGRILMVEGAFVRRAEPLRDLDRWWSLGRLAWPFGPLTPRASLEGTDRQTAGAGTSTIRNRWWESRAGIASTGADGRFSGDLDLRSRLDQSDRGFLREPVDSGRSRGARLDLSWTDLAWSAEGLVDGDLSERRTSGGDWIGEQSWLGESNLSAYPTDGLEIEVQWRLTRSDFQPEIANWDTVPAGTGTHKWDSLSRRVVPADDGNLVSGGIRLDTSRAPVRSERRRLALEATIEPGRILPDLEGVFADIGTHARWEWEQADSSERIRLLPDFDDDALANSLEGRSSLQADLWWERGAHRLDAQWRRDWIATGGSSWSSGGTERDLDVGAGWTWTSPKGHRMELPWRRTDRILRGTDLSRRETVHRLEPGLSLRLAPPLDLRPSGSFVLGSGHDGPETIRGTAISPALGARLRLGLSGVARSEVRYARATAEGPAGSSLTDGWYAGRTWRASAGFDWVVSEHVSASADWIWRLDPGRPGFQKASAEARAVF